MRVLVLVALSACSIKPIDYTGKECSGGACPAGYECNLATNTCSKDVIIDSPLTTDDGPVTTDDGPVPSADGSPDANEVMGESCLVNPRSTLVYSDPAFANFPTNWNQNGTWYKASGELRQGNNSIVTAWTARTIPTSQPGNYRIVATMHRRYAGDELGISFRVNTQQVVMYACVLDTATGRLELRYTLQGINNVLDGRNLVIDPQATFTLEVDATGTTLTCCVRGIAGSNISVSNPSLTMGGAGVTTHASEGAFLSFYAYE